MRHGHFDSDSDTAIRWHALKHTLPYLLEFRYRVIFALFCMALAKIANVAGPLLLKHVVDTLDQQFSNHATAGQSASDGSYAVALAIPLALIVAYGLARFSNVLLGEIRDTVFGRVTERAMRRIGLRVFEHLHALDLDFHLNRRTGALARDIERGTTGIGFLMRFLVFNIVPTLLEILMIAGVLLYNYGADFAITIVIAVALYIAFSIVATDWRTQYVREANLADSASNTRAIDSLINYETVKYFTNESFESERYDHDLAHWERARRMNRLSLFTLNAGQALIIATATTVLVWLAATRVARGDMSLGDFVAVNSYMVILFMPLNFLGFVYREIKGSLANIEKMFDLLQVEPKVVDIPAAPDLRIHRGEIRFEGVSFSYRPDRPILQEITFTVHPGQKVAVVGASGAGKSTLVKLLFRFYDCNSGSILIDDQNIREVRQHSLRAAIGIVPQDCVLFNDTLFENVRYGRPDASPAEVEQAITLAHLNDFIAQLPEGYNTRVGERGLKLSGGEKQRVAIARAILKRPPILVFDEATSSLDSHSEQAILRAIAEISRNHTSLVIAHRLSTIVDADTILVLDQGRILEQGNHTELVALNGCYARLWQAQQRRQTISDSGHQY